MVILDPCARLKTIKNQLVPAILTSAKYDIDTLDIKSAIEKNLPDLERNCYELAERCKKQWPTCGKEIELCNRDAIEKLFHDTRQELKKIWEEKEKKKKEMKGIS